MPRKLKETLVVTNKTQIALAAALIAAFATPALARDGRTDHVRHQNRYEQSYREPAPRYFEGRNAAVYGGFGGYYGGYGGTSTSRDALVQTPGN
jgi:hypothetical protein